MKHSAPTRQLLAAFDALHVQHLGVRAVIRGGKDAKLLADFWRTHGDLVEVLMGDFFEMDDEFVQQAGYSVGVFISQASKLIARRMKKQQAAREYWHDECARLHGGRCEKALHHWTKMRTPA